MIKLKSITLILCLGSVISCDIVQEDSTPSLSAKSYTYANKPAVVNISTLTGGRKFNVQSQANPQFGTFETVLGGQYLLYHPNSSFAGKVENMAVTLSEVGSSQKANLNLSFHSLDGSSTGCSGLSGIYDYAQIKSGESIVIDLLDNDIFCGVNYNGGIIGEAALEGVTTEDFMLALGPGRLAEFRYTATPGFTGKIKVIYNLGINWIPDSGYESLTGEQILANPGKYLEAFTTAMVEIDVIP